jgi:hypothetical protein
MGECSPPLRKYLPGITFIGGAGFPALFKDFVCVKRETIIEERDPKEPRIRTCEIY